MFRKFETVEEADVYLGKNVLVGNRAAKLIQINFDEDLLNFTFEFEDKTIKVIDSESAFNTVSIYGHLFGIETKKTADMKKYRHELYMANKQHRIEYQRKYYLEHKETLKKKANEKYRKMCGL